MDGSRHLKGYEAHDDVTKHSEGLAHVLWRVAKQLVSLLEKEYGFGEAKEVGQCIPGPTGNILRPGSYRVNGDFSGDQCIIVGRDRIDHEAADDCTRREDAELNYFDAEDASRLERRE